MKVHILTFCTLFIIEKKLFWNSPHEILTHYRTYKIIEFLDAKQCDGIFQSLEIEVMYNEGTGAQ